MKRVCLITLVTLMLFVLCGCAVFESTFDGLRNEEDAYTLSVKSVTVGSNARYLPSTQRYKTSLEMFQKASRRRYGDLIDVTSVKNVFDYDYILMTGMDGRYALMKEPVFVEIEIRQLQKEEHLAMEAYKFSERYDEYIIFDDYRDYVAYVGDFRESINVFKFVKEGVNVYLVPSYWYDNGVYYYAYTLLFRIGDYVFKVRDDVRYMLPESRVLPTQEELEGQKSVYESKNLSTIYEMTDFYTEESELMRILKEEVWVAQIPIATE